jgi:hypothetical protein
MLLSILDSIFKFSAKKSQNVCFLDQVGMPWIPIPIRIRIRGNDADMPRSGSGSSTMEKPEMSKKRQVDIYMQTFPDET